jgi:hypothetical protein
MPGGAGLCCYVLICPCCAAGDIAHVIHEDFCVTCCVMPCIMGWPCWWAHNRKKLAEKFGIEDPYLHSPLGSAAPCLLHASGCCEWKWFCPRDMAVERVFFYVSFTPYTVQPLCTACARSHTYTPPFFFSYLPAYSGIEPR